MTDFKPLKLFSWNVSFPIECLVLLFIKNFKEIYFCFYLYVYVSLYAFGFLQRPEVGIKSPEVGLTSDYELSNLGAGN